MTFIRIVENNETIFLNLNNVIDINEKAGMVCTNGIEVSLDGSIKPRIYRFSKKNIEQILDVISKSGNCWWR